MQASREPCCCCRIAAILGSPVPKYQAKNSTRPTPQAPDRALDSGELQFVEKGLIQANIIQRCATMTSERQKLPKNAAKVEFIVHAETIRALLNEGYNLRNVYNKLRELHNISMSYFTLCDWYRRTFKEEKNNERTKHIMTPKIPSAPAVPKKLTRPEDIDRSSLF